MDICIFSPLNAFPRCVLLKHSYCEFCSHTQSTCGSFGWDDFLQYGISTYIFYWLRSRSIDIYAFSISYGLRWNDQWDNIYWRTSSRKADTYTASNLGGLHSHVPPSYPVVWLRNCTIHTWNLSTMDVFFSWFWYHLFVHLQFFLLRFLLQFLQSMWMCFFLCLFPE